jgi:hypothetical protein
MSRPVGVIASAVVAILGSIVALLFAGFSVASLFVAPLHPQPPNAAQAITVSAVMFTALAAIGIWTSVGLFRLRPWARTAMLIFAGFVAASCIFALLVTMTVPLPPQITGGTRQAFRHIMAVVFGIPLVISVWWLFEFNRPSTKAAFLSPQLEGSSARPLSITVIAVSMALSCFGCLVPLLMREPVFVVGAVVSGWMATVIYAVLAALSVYIAKGLFDLRERARLLAIAWFGFGFLNASVVGLLPSLRAHLMMQAALANSPQAPIPFDVGVLMDWSLAIAVAVALTAIWFLGHDRPAFVRAENARDWPGLHA